MLGQKIIALKNKWLALPSCQVSSLLGYIRAQNKLREAQIEAIEIYLFLKIVGDNKPLGQLFSEGFFTPATVDEDTPLTVAARQYLTEHSVARALYYFSCEEINNKQRFPDLAEQIMLAPDSIDYEDVISKIFYEVSYSDYLFSLPMGAGKTYLMAAIIYLELYFSQNEPDNPNFAHNFLVLIPSGLKTSITASLRTIIDFDGSWVLPAEKAAAIKHQLKFDILDEAKAANKSNKTSNPNAAKINSILPDPYGYIFVVNAEKLILEGRKYELFEDDEMPNELRCKLAEIPNLALFMDEAHHTTDKDIKLRQVVNWWAKNKDYKGNITSVLSFTGTPYLSKAENIKVTDTITLKNSTITNTVYYYPLTTAIATFLKRPTVKSDNLSKEEIIKYAVVDFEAQYGNKIYTDGTIAKCAIYCSNIADLEETVYPCLRELNIADDVILKFHKGNSQYKLPSENEIAFRSLDHANSRHRYILLVGVGKEGWDCRSLTAVVLSGEGDSPKNMVLQTSCRCLRQVEDEDSTALIWLNESNAKILNDQLKKEQQTSIEDINAICRSTQYDVVRHSRMAILSLPKIEFYQLRINYKTTASEDNPNTKEKIKNIINQLEDKYRKTSVATEGDFEDIFKERSAEYFAAGEVMSFNHWLFNISKNSFGNICPSDVAPYHNQLKKIYDRISENGVLNTRYNIVAIHNDIALAFSIKRTLHSEAEAIRKQASMLLETKLTAVAESNSLYPDRVGSEQILNADIDADMANDNKFQEQQAEKIKQLLAEGNMAAIGKVAQTKLHCAVKHKERSFHYIPYNFSQSKFEKEILEQALTLQTDHDFEIYYNGERGLTEFVIQCYWQEKCRYKYLGRYTPDFLFIQRQAKKQIDKVLIVETKGSGYAHDPDFNAKKEFINGKFIAENERQFGYKKFDFLYLEDSDSMNKNLIKITNSVKTFFRGNNNAD